MGKTFTINNLTASLPNNDYIYHIISSDKIRKSLVDEYLLKNKNSNYDEAFKRVGKAAIH